MGLFLTELYKILRRRPVWLSLIAVTAFLTVWVLVWASEEDTVADGVRYHGFAAIEKDREIARQWEGTLTMEKLCDIVNTYGLAVNEQPQWSSARGGNWVSRYATDMLTDFLRREDHTGADRLDADALARLEQTLSQYEPHFCYMENAGMLYEAAFSINLLLLLLITFALVPVFTEEYRCNTLPVIRGCAKGRERIAGIKVAAAFVFAQAVYLVENAALVAVFCACFGSDWMGGGAGLVSWVSVPHYRGLLIWQAYLIQFFWGMLGIWVMVSVALLFSVTCRQTFLAMAGSLLFLGGGYVMPIILMQIILPRWLMRLTGWIFECNPYYLMTSISRGSYLGERWRFWLIVAVIAAFLCAVWKQWKRQER